MEWSVWPPDAIDTLGEPITLTAGQALDLTAEIAAVVDTSGAISGDFHVHGVNSPDSPVLFTDRVLSFLGEGVDVLVSTDHDFITDYAPRIQEMNAQDELVSLVGLEITTFDYGHYNGFPLVADLALRNGGAMDWAGGPEEGKTPGEIFEWVASFEGEQVIQINHAGTGFISSLKADVLHGLTLADPTDFRLPATEPDPVTGDTGLWSEDFTAMEILNGHSMSDFWVIFRWWTTMIGRGFSPTGTAVSDTHKIIASQAGSPRSFIFVDSEHDTVPTFDKPTYVKAVNEGRLIGTNGPFFRLVAENEVGDQALIGDTLTSAIGETVSVYVHMSLPEWMEVDTLDVYMNLTDEVNTNPGQKISSEVEPTVRIPILLGEDDLEVVAQGLVTHRRYTKTISFDINVERDSYVIVMIRGMGEESPTMYPVVHNKGVRAFAFSNPLYIDADGNGYDQFPMQELLDEPPASMGANPFAINARRRATRADVRDYMYHLGQSHKH
jgi:hypothetical protein